MKKLFVMTLAVAALASCSKVEPIEPGYKSAIGFENAFIDNATKAELNTGNILSFEVWGTEAKAPIFNATTVSRADASSPWGYTGTKYWHPGNHYEFAAIAPAGHGGTVTLESNDVATIKLPISVGYTLAAGNIGSQTDLLYATANVDTPNPLTTMADVAFTFKHLLSKVQFTFTNGHADGSNYNVIVKNVTIAAKAQSTVDLTDADYPWATPTGDVTLNFPTFNGEVAFGPGATGVSDHQSLIIPNTGVAYSVAGTAEIYVGTTKVETRDIEGEIPADSFESGVFYNVTATIASTNEIKFTVSAVTGWNNSATDVAM